MDKVTDSCGFREKKKMSSRASRTIYAGNLPGDIRMREIEDLFIKVSHSLFHFWSFSVALLWGEHILLFCVIINNRFFFYFFFIFFGLC